ncbi:MAG TPA: histidine kinase [Bryobacteraceae bacterium]|nr:histidine kinase [Bryobacteraceae bacterium]
MNELHKSCRFPIGAYTLRPSYLLRVALICGLAALGATALSAATSPGSSLLRTFLQSVTYSYSIGGLCGVILPAASQVVVRYHMPVQLLAMAVVIALLTVIGCALGGAVLILLRQESPLESWASYFRVVRFSLVISLTAGLGAYLYHAMRYEVEAARVEARTRQFAEERAKKLAAEARLSSLESRIHPHFLFNTLNSIASLVHDEPQRAEDTVGRLAALLRFSLDANQRSLVLLEQEMKIVRDYLEIEKTRLGERLRYTIDVPREMGNALVPPLAIESLVENSVKHVIAKRREGGEIAVRAWKEAGTITIEVADSGPGFSLASVPAGRGIDTLLARLEVLYEGRARVEVTPGADGSSVRLALPEIE